ncbi:MAG: HNH endonuclease family protein [Pseudonocardiaceae bacterium]
MSSSPLFPLRRLTIALVLALSAIFSLALPADATPPGIPSPAEAEAEEMLAELTIAPEGSQSQYSRAKFPHWITVSGTCNTREWVLRRDGMGVQTGPDCSPTSGSWLSPYDGATWFDASDVDIDHVVPLAEAWRSGASEWTQPQRQSFANDLNGPQLIAVTDNLNQAKGDRSPDQWRPPLMSYWCVYASMWTDVKHTWKLTATTTEVAALHDMLRPC